MRSGIAMITAGALALAGTGAVVAPAAAASAKVTIAGIGRDGRPVQPQAEIIALGSGKSYGNTGRRVRSLPAGTYAITAQIEDARTATLGTRIVTVRGDTTVRFDAREGRRVRVKVSDDPAARLRLLVAVPEIDGAAGFDGGAISFDQVPYAIPMTDRHVTWAVHALLEHKAKPSPVVYSLVRRVPGGIPSAPGFTVQRSDLARVDLEVRGLDPGSKASLDLGPRTTYSPGANLGLLGSDLGALPRRVTSYRTPGWVWAETVNVLGAETLYREAPYGRGKRYRQVWGAAVWGPAAAPFVRSIDYRILLVRTAGNLCPATVASGCLYSRATTATRLYSYGTLLASGRNSLHRGIPDYDRWYRVDVESTRPAGSVLSSRVLAFWRFEARGARSGTPAPKLGNLSIAAGGLDATNTAAAGSSTPVTLRVTGLGKVTGVQLKRSTDGGTTWTPVRLVRSAGAWTADVPNPSGAGTVSLRATARAKGGGATGQTVIGAWTVR